MNAETNNPRGGLEERVTRVETRQVDMKNTLDKVDSKVDLLLEEAQRARGRAEVRAGIFGLPGATWVSVLLALGVAGAALAGLRVH
jgi:hypothetical protein